MSDADDRALAVWPLKSFRYASQYGWVMIGARDVTEALREADRSIHGPADPAKLQVWRDYEYVPV